MATPFDGGTQAHTGSVIAENVTLTLGGKAVLVQQFQFTVNRSVNFLYEIGSNNVYYVGNRRQGQGQLVRVVAGGGQFAQLLTTYGKMCTPKQMVLTGSPCKGGGAVTYTLKDATLTSVGASVTAQDVVINENLGFVCSDIDVT
jgi:hypothetical protein